MTHFFQPLDLTVNGEAKRFMKDMLTTWYSGEVQKQMESENSTVEIEVDLRLSMLKPLHVTWLVSGKAHCKRMAQSGNIRTSSRKDNLIT